ncbi:hypothetical protein EMIT093MI4_170093 [Pseudomonas sp. IT-93MI4]
MMLAAAQQLLFTGVAIQLFMRSKAGRVSVVFCTFLMPLSSGVRQ